MVPPGTRFSISLFQARDCVCTSFAYICMWCCKAQQNMGKTHFFSPGCLPAWIRAWCAERRPIKSFPHLALHPPLGHPFLHLSPPVELGPQVSSQEERPSQDLASPGPGSAAHLLCGLTSHFSSQCLNLPLYELGVYRRSGSGGCVSEEVSLY